MACDELNVGGVEACSACMPRARPRRRLDVALRGRHGGHRSPCPLRAARQTIGGAIARLPRWQRTPGARRRACGARMRPWNCAVFLACSGALPSASSRPVQPVAGCASASGPLSHTNFHVIGHYSRVKPGFDDMEPGGETLWSWLPEILGERATIHSSRVASGRITTPGRGGMLGRGFLGHRDEADDPRAGTVGWSRRVTGAR